MANDIAVFRDTPRIETVSREARAKFGARLSIYSLPAIVFGALTLLLARPARADVYSEAEQVIKQLIVNDVAENVIPNAAMHVQPVCDYFPATVNAIRTKRFSGLEVLVRHEAADAAGHLFTCRIHPGAPLCPSDTNSTPTAARMSIDTLNSASAKSGAAHGPKVCKQPDGTPWTTATWAKATSVGTASMTECLRPQSTAQADVACAAGLLARDAVNGDKNALAHDARRLIVDIGTDAFLHVRMNAPGASAPPLTEEKRKEVVALGLDLLEGRTTLDALKQDLANALDKTAFAQDASVLVGSFARLRRSTVSADDMRAVFTAVGEALERYSEKATPAAGVVPAPAWVATLNVDLHSTLGAAADPFGTLLQAVAARDYGGAAGDVVDVVFAVTCSTGTHDIEGDVCKVKPFTRNLAVYLVDAATSSGNTATAEGAFRDAALDLITQANGGGMHRHWAYGWWAPELSYRYAWIPGRPDASGATLGWYVSVDMITLRAVLWYDDNLYAAMHLSGVDLLGPIREVATRPASLNNPTQYDLKAAAYAALVPRADVEFGIPSLSQHFVIGLGVAGRFYRVGQFADGTPTYCFSFKANDCVSSPIGFIEGSAFAKYLL